MQITRGQNQPNFGAKKIVPDSKLMGKYLKDHEIDAFERQACFLDHCGGDEQAMHLVGFNPARYEPFSVLSQIMDETGRKIVKFHEDLNIKDLARVAMEHFDEGFSELHAPAVHTPINDELKALRNAKRIEAMENVIITRVPPPQK